MDDDSDSRPSFSASGNSQQLSNHGLEGDEYFEDPQNMYGEDIINEDHIIYGYVDNDDDYPEYAHLIDEDNLRLVDDMAYVEDLEMPDLASFPSEQDEEVKKDLFAIVAGVMMANGSKLDSGLTAAEFDLQLQEVTGGQINMLSMAAFMKISNEEVDAINKQKGNLLLHDVFKGHLYYSAADGTFKLNPPSQLKELRETIKHGSACREKRKEKANIVKNARMRDPEFRKKLMVSNNFLVELIVACCNSLFTTKVTWVQVQAEYKKMMTEETFLYSKYKQPLRLDMIRENIGPMLNANACRELFGRGTVSKALSSEIFGKIKWTNNENQLILHLGGDFKNSLKDFTYNAADFKDVQERIDREKARSDVGTTRRPDRPRQPTRLEREQQELEERKKTFEPIMPPDTFIPNFNEMAHRFHPGNKIRHAGATTTTRAVVTNVFDETVNDHFLTNTVQDIPNHREAQRPDDSPNIFGGGRTARSVSDEALSSVGSARANEVNFTDDEAEEKSPKREAIANKAEEQEKNTTPKSKVILEMFGDTKLVKKNGIVAHPEKLLRDKVIGFFFSALGNPCAKSDAAVLKEFHTKMKTSYQPFEVVYVSFDTDEKDFERHFQGDHGDWLAIPFGTKKLAEIKARFPTAGLSQLHVLKPDGTCATEEGMVEIKYSKNHKACFDKWLKFGNPMNMSQPEALPQIVATSASRWKVPVESETAREKYNRVDQFIGDAAQPESSAYGSTVLRQPRIRSSISAAFQNHCPSEQSKKPRPPRLTARKIVDDYQDDSEDPSLMSHKALFILHIKLHVYLHRNIDGAPIRYWSRMMSYLPPPFNMPQVFLGDDWVATLMDAIPCLQVTATPHDDLLFDWVDKNMTRGENVSIRY